MRKLLFTLIFLLTVITVSAQFSPTGTKTRFVNGLALGTKLDGSLSAQVDSNAIWWRADSALMVKYKGASFRIGQAGSGGSVLYSDTSAMLANRLKISDTLTQLSGYVRKGFPVLYTDSASMLANRLKISDTSLMLINYPRYDGTRATGTWNIGITGNATTATALATGRTIAITGDLAYTSPSFDGSGNITAAGTLASIITAGGPIGSASVVPIITWDAKGRLTAVSTATIVAGSTSGILTLGTDLSGGSYNGSTNVTVNNASTLATVTGRGNSTSSGISLTENGNLAASYALYLKRNTDTGPLGYFIQAQNAAANANLFTVDVSGNIIGAGTISASNFSGTSSGANTGDQTITLTGNVTGSGTGSFATTIAAGVVTTAMMASANISQWTNNSGYLTSSTGVTTFSAGTTGLTPAAATSGAITLAGTLAIANGGTGSTTAQGAINTLAGAVTSAQYLRGNGTNVVMSAIQVSDVPTLNQNTTGTASNVTGIVAVANGGTGSSTQNFVDLTTTQNVAGLKTFTNVFSVNATVAASNNVNIINTSATGYGIYVAAGNASNYALHINDYLGTSNIADFRNGAINFYGNSLAAGSISGSTAAFSGVLNSTAANEFITNTSSTTGSSTIRIANTGANLYFGINNSEGGNIVATSPNATYILNRTATDIVFITNEIARQTINGTTGATNFSSTIGASNFSGTSSGANTGDQTITLTGNVTGSGTGSFATTIAAGVVTTAMMASANISQWTNNSGYLTSSTGVTTFSAGTTGLTPSAATSGAITLAGTLAIANGGTGSGTQNFVDLTTAQSIAGVKTFSSLITSTLTSSSIFENIVASTSLKYLRVMSTGASSIFGIEGSIGGQINASAPAYATSIGTQNSTSLTFGTNGVTRQIIDQLGTTTFSGILNANANISNYYSAVVTGSATTGQSYGLTVRAGTNSSDYSFSVVNQLNTIAYFQVRGDGQSIFSGNVTSPGGLWQQNQLTQYVSVGASNVAWAWQLSDLTSGDMSLSSGTTAAGGPFTRKMNITSAGAATFYGSLTASSLIISGGTSSQFMKADGSVDANDYLLTSSINQGTTNYVAKYAASLTIVNSQIFDNGTNVTINKGTPTANTRFQIRGASAYTSNTNFTLTTEDANGILGFTVDDAGNISSKGVSANYTAVTAAYTILSYDYMIVATGGSNYTITLPTAVGILGKIYIIKNNGATNPTLGTTSSQTIDGATTKSLATTYSTYMVQSDGANWNVITFF